MTRWCSLVLTCLALAGCARSSRDRGWLNRQLLERAGAETGACPGAVLPRGVRLADGIDEAEVVAVALCRNPALRAELTRIDAARATLREASRPDNPQLSLMGPLGPITAVATLFVPLQSLWQMPARTKAAAREADVAGEAVLMRALDLVRDARVQHVELGLAADRAEVRAELARVAAEVARIAAVRARVGEISPLEERVLAADAQASLDAGELAQTETVLARARLSATLALDAGAGDALRATFATQLAGAPALRDLIQVARVARPDARSAELSVAAATARAGWEHSRVVNLGALVETQWDQPAGPALRLGGRAELPLFHWNPGGIGRAEAEVQRAVAQHEVVARTVILEVTTAHARFAQASRSLARFESEILPALDAALAMAQGGFEVGDQSYLVVLDVLRRAGEARLRRAELLAEQRRALCELERAAGARLGATEAMAQNERRERRDP